MTAIQAEKVEFSPELRQFIEKWKGEPGNLIMVLHKTQQEFGYLPRKVAIQLSRELDIPLARIYGVLTFYHYFKLTKPGRHNIQICLGTACYLKDSEDIILELETLLGIGVNQVTPDGEFSVEAVRCVGCCGLAPVAVISGEVFGKITPDMMPTIIAKFKGK